MTDSLSLQRIIDEIMPDEVYNLAAQSHVAVSFNQPEYTANSDALGTLRILETIKKIKKKKIKFYQAGTSEMYGKVQEIPQSEKLISIQEVHTPQQNYMLIGLQLTIEKLTIFLLVMAYYLIMKVQEEEKHL